MELIAVVIGYILGATPFMVYFLWQNGVLKNKKDVIQDEKNIFNEWLYGTQEEEKKQTNQEKIYKEYITGEDSK